MKKMRRKYIFSIISLFIIFCSTSFCFINVNAETVENNSNNEERNSVNKKIVYDVTKSVITTGDKPATLSTNCKDAIEQYWSKTTTIVGSGSMDSISNESNSVPDQLVIDSNVNLSAREKPLGKTAIDSALDSMSDIELLSRLIKSEQGGNSFESQVLVGITVLNRGNDLKVVAKDKYTSGGAIYYSYNGVEGDLFWQAVSQESLNAANKAIQAKKTGTYKVIDVKSNKSVEAIKASGFFAADDISKFNNKWYNWSLIAILENRSGKKYTGYYGYK